MAKIFAPTNPEMSERENGISPVCGTLPLRVWCF